MTGKEVDSKLIMYPQMTRLSKEYVTGKILEFMAEDIPDGDKTTLGTIPEERNITGEVQVEEEMVFAGEHVLPHCFPSPCKVVLNVRDGELVSAGSIIASVQGPSRTVLSRERIMLNLVQRLCGIAGATNRYVRKAAPFGVAILDTRKTTPGLRLFEKYAVSAGGGRNHRMDLSSGILIKDNHLQAAGGIAEAVASVKSKKFDLPVELEVDTISQVKEGLLAGVDGFLLDNMSPDEVHRAVTVIRAHIGGEEIFIEASGGITLDNIDGYFTTGIDAISIGALTHSVRNAKIRLEFTST